MLPNEAMEDLSFPVSRKSRVQMCSELHGQSPEVDMIRPVALEKKV